MKLMTISKVYLLFYRYENIQIMQKFPKEMCQREVLSGGFNLDHWEFEN